MRKVYLFVAAAIVTGAVGGCRSGRKVCVSAMTVDSAVSESRRVVVGQSSERDSVAWVRDVAIDSMVYMIGGRDSFPAARLTAYGVNMSARRRSVRRVERADKDSELVRTDRRNESIAVESRMAPSPGVKGSWRIFLCLIAGAAMWGFIRRFFGCGGDRP